ncbi:RluA family pseudouridine synthase [Rheinheimera sp. MMS21-TC3]|uniref:RluA family pseudouridine synthase n=1 Tax=Rheinheimera sp. MMS21-TC3 TaxID=3072790 RepID=UPI0028C3E2F1|nr:RluA family pseudouridine synthase [Rheinheimera sp. MMS21-TC3]WNO62131.1 RluA family pseudouridine synthase [Rheinheimera sp. MMS21-TC3]
MKLVRNLTVEQPITAIELLAKVLPELSKSRLKDAMAKGAVLLNTKPKKRLRRAQTALLPGQKLEIHYDDDLLQRQCDKAVLLHDMQGYSVWFKPAGMLSQGNEWGDHLALLRAVELHFGHKRPVFLLHRLDREASGLVLLAHSKKMAAAFSKMIANHAIDKEYLVAVKGELSRELQQTAKIVSSLDGKACETQFYNVHYAADLNQSKLQVKLISGRKHQIRRHFAAIQHPVIGDPMYGDNNKDSKGLALQAVGLSFNCPQTQQRQNISLPAHLQHISVSF